MNILSIKKEHLPIPFSFNVLSNFKHSRSSFSVLITGSDVYRDIEQGFIIVLKLFLKLFLLSDKIAKCIVHSKEHNVES